MKTQPSPGYHRTNLNSFTRIAAFVALVALIGIPLFSSSLASSTSEPSRALPVPRLVSDKGATVNSSVVFGHFLNASKQRALLPFSPALAETIATFAADCTTPRSSFFLGETVCAQTDNVDLNFPGGRWVHWLRPDLSIAYGGNGVTDITVNPQTFTFVPDVTGTWKVTIAETGDISQTPAVFTVDPVPPLATYAADCLTPKSTFNLGDTVCARAVGFAGSNNRFAWIDPANLVRTFTPITADPQSDSFNLPSTETDLIDIFLVDNRGTWKVNVLSGDGRRLESVPFTVSGTTAAADLSLTKSINGGAPDAGSNYSYNLTLTNFGPNAASTISLSDPNPVNATFVSVTQLSGPTFSCSGSDPVVCTRSSLAAGETVSFELTYTAGAADSDVTNVASVTSTTTELNPSDNTANSGRVTIGGGTGTPPTCSLECPNDITVATNTTGGANVTFGSPDTFGDCGTVNTNHASGSFFPIGTTTVTATSSTGGGSCTFTVTVIDVPSPTISCPANQTVAAPSGATEVTVSTGSPTATGTGVTVVGIRDDEVSVNDPYPIGTTIITWQATDQFGRIASCVQSITVTSTDAPTISCPSDKTFTAPSGDCTFTATAAQIGTPTSTGPGVSITSRRSDDLPLTDPFPAGQTFITWTATNSVGAASCIQRITVIATDTVAPTLVVPADINTTTSSCSVLLDDELGVATADDNCSQSVNITRTGIPRVPCPIPGNPNRTCESFVFPTGTTIITYTATDAAGNSTVGIQTITVLESPAIPPTISAPADVTVNTGPDATSCGAVVADAVLGTATGNDNCAGVTVTRSGVPAGNAFPVGNTVVTYTATDASGNTAQDTQTVTVVDNTPPVVTAPAAVTLFTGPGATSCGVTVTNLDGTFGTGSAIDNCPGVGAVSRSGIPSGNNFPVGITTLTYSATDAHGNTGSATQTVTVIDNTAPLISCPASITIEPTCPTGAIATYTAPVGTDNCPGATTSRTAGLASGSVFPIGATTVTFTVNDAHGNSASCSFTVTVLTPQAVIQNLITSVNASSLTGTQKNGLLAKLNAALSGINNGQTNTACNKLSEFVNSVGTLISHGDISAAQGNAWISSANHVRNTIGCTNLPCS
jgi:uncharacterized repeat protein (TIGR01451 family)